MRVLVTGATGLVGNNVVRELIRQGHVARVVTRPNSDLRPFEGLQVETFSGDVRDADSVRRAAQDVEGIIHAAAIVHFGWRRGDEQRAVNVDGTRNVAAAARASGARLIHVSSVDALAPGRRDQPADETTPLAVKVPCGYVLSKREAEQVVLDEVRAGLRAVIVNPGLMFGPWDWKPSSGRMVLAVAHQFTRASPSGGVSVCDVRDVASAAIRALDHGRTGERYILAGHNITYFELWRKIAEITGGTRPWFRLGPLVRMAIGRFGDLRTNLTGVETDVNSAAIAMSSLYHYYNCQRAIAELGYVIRPLEETLQDAWEWLRQRFDRSKL